MQIRTPVLRLSFLLVLAALLAAPASAEVKELRIARSDGLGYLPILMMEHHKLVEKHFRASGLGDVRVTWARFAGGVQMNDSLLAGSLDFASGGVPPFLTLWSRTHGTPQAVRAVCALAGYPYLLVSRNPAVKSIRDLTPKDRIALPAVKASIQAVLLQMAAAKEFGREHYARLDPLTVSMSNPDGLVALLSGKGEITAHFSNPPFQYQALRAPGTHAILHSTDVLGGASTSILVWTTARFHDENPKSYAAFVAAFEEANAIIRKDLRAAVALYRDLTKDKDTLDNLFAMAKDMDYDTTPKNTMKFVDFMHGIGTIKVRPSGWKDLFFPGLHDRSGS